MDITKKTVSIVMIVVLILGLGLWTQKEYSFAATGQYTVKYMEKGTSNRLREDKVVSNQEMGATVIEEAPSIEGFFTPVEPKKEVIVGEIEEIVFYYSPDTLTTVEPTEEDNEDVQPRGTTIPTDSMSLANGKIYKVSSGDNARVDVLYTNYKFYGKTSYTVRIHNSNNYAVKVIAKSALKTYNQIELQPGSTVHLSVHTESTSKKFYVKFKSTGSTLEFGGEIS